MLGAASWRGYPIVDVKVTLYDGSYHAVDSSEMAFKMATYIAMKKIFVEAHPILLEPIMDISLSLPEEFTGDAMSDLSTRRAHIEGMEAGVIRARIPLAELAGLVAGAELHQGQGHRGRASMATRTCRNISAEAHPAS
jgi:elongation factor G